MNTRIQHSYLTKLIARTHTILQHEQWIRDFYTIFYSPARSLSISNYNAGIRWMLSSNWAHMFLLEPMRKNGTLELLTFQTFNLLTIFMLKLLSRHRNKRTFQRCYDMLAQLASFITKFIKCILCTLFTYASLSTATEHVILFYMKRTQCRIKRYILNKHNQNIERNRSIQLENGMKSTTPHI